MKKISSCHLNIVLLFPGIHIMSRKIEGYDSRVENFKGMRLNFWRVRDLYVMRKEKSYLGPLRSGNLSVCSCHGSTSIDSTELENISQFTGYGRAGDSL